MTKKIAILLSAIICVIACKESRPLYTLHGAYGAGNDTLLLLGFDSRHDRTDTLVTDGSGKFRYTLETDTVVPLIMLLPDGNMLPIFAEPHATAEVRPDTVPPHRLFVAGGETQAAYNKITAHIATLKSKTQINAAIDTFIRENPLSDVNLLLLQEHIIETPESQIASIQGRISKLGGTLQDNSYIARFKESNRQKKSNAVQKAFPAFTFTTADSTIVKQSGYRNKYLLVTLWASWDSLSRAHVRTLRNISATKDTAHFAVLNISLDYDTAAWRKCLTTDSIIGDNVCDTKMWQNSIVDNFNIDKLPFNIFVNPYQRTIKFNISNEELQNDGDSLINKFKEELRKKREREAARKKRNKK